MNELDITIIKTMASTNMNRTETARLLNYHPNSMLYRFKVIKRETGKDPRVFYDLIDLLLMIKKQQKSESLHKIS